jgi:hypothetical protein
VEEEHDFGAFAPGSGRAYRPKPVIPLLIPRKPPFGFRPNTAAFAFGRFAPKDVNQSQLIAFETCYSRSPRGGKTPADGIAEY